MEGLCHVITCLLDMLDKNGAIPKLSAEGEIDKLGCQVRVESLLSGGAVITAYSGYNKMAYVMDSQDIHKKIIGLLKKWRTNTNVTRLDDVQIVLYSMVPDVQTSTEYIVGCSSNMSLFQNLS
jgi:hypothetical protein